MDEPAPEKVTQLLAAIGDGEHHAAAELLPIVYESLRRLAQGKMAAEPAGHTLQPTALVHEAYLRLVGDDPAAGSWQNRGHFYAAAGEAMRRILVERARRVHQLKRGGGRRRVPLRDAAGREAIDAADVIVLDEALRELAATDRRMHDVVMLRYFAGLSVDETAAAMDLSPRTVDRAWRCARLRLYESMAADAGEVGVRDER
jgi:RNA polymerase sigma factor (TIGR02999 family)